VNSSPAYSHSGMVVDVSHTGDRTSLDAIEVSEHPVVSSHLVSLSRGRVAPIDRATGQPQPRGNRRVEKGARYSA
jgi:hypothetical protein